MKAIEKLANDIAMLSNDDLTTLAEILAKDYPLAADNLQSSLCWAEFEKTGA